MNIQIILNDFEEIAVKIQGSKSQRLKAVNTNGPKAPRAKPDINNRNLLKKPIQEVRRFHPLTGNCALRGDEMETLKNMTKYKAKITETGEKRGKWIHGVTITLKPEISENFKMKEQKPLLQKLLNEILLEINKPVLCYLIFELTKENNYHMHGYIASSLKEFKEFRVQTNKRVGKMHCVKYKDLEHPQMSGGRKYGFLNYWDYIHKEESKDGLNGNLFTNMESP